MLWKYWKIFAAIYLGILFRALIVRSLYPIPLEKEFINLSWWITIPIGIGNLSLIWLVGKKFFGEKVAIFSVILYAISPWFAYLEVAGSTYIFLLFVLLLYFYLIFQSRRSVQFIVPIIILTTFLLYIDITKFNSIFADVGIINSINQFQGETKEVGFGMIGRLVENKYTYIAQYLLFNFLKHFTPATYFTSEYRLLNLSNNPTILIGFLIPFILGISGWFRLWRKYKLVILTSVLLLIPSAFSKQSPSFSNLVLFAPAIIFTISYGYINYLAYARNNLFRILFILTLILVIIQMFVIIFDLALRESVRFHG